MKIEVPVSVGELLDKISILEIKMKRIPDAEKRRNVYAELSELRRLRPTLPGEVIPIYEELRKINEMLWDIENTARKFEREKNFGTAFVLNARLVYRCNDRRAAFKRDINRITNSEIVEEKHHDHD